MEEVTDLLEFIERVERSHFRTNGDTGANHNALIIWNIVRAEAGLPRLTHDDLRQRHVDTSNSVDSIEEMKRFEKWCEDDYLWSSFPAKEKRYRELEAAGGRDGLMARLKEKK